MKYTVFPIIDLQEVPKDEIDKRNLVPRKSVNESETLMKCQQYTQLKKQLINTENGKICKLQSNRYLA